MVVEVAAAVVPEEEVGRIVVLGFEARSITGRFLADLIRIFRVEGIL